jgi:hypothetical protein
VPPPGSRWRCPPTVRTNQFPLPVSELSADAHADGGRVLAPCAATDADTGTAWLKSWGKSISVTRDVPPVLPRTETESNNLLTIVGTIISQAALITGVFYYVGWARTDSLFRYFGVDAALVGLSAPDYVLRGGSDVIHDVWIYLVFATFLGLVAIHCLVIIPALIDATLPLSLPSNPTTGNLCSPDHPYADRSGLRRSIVSTICLSRVLDRWRPRVSSIRRFINRLRVFAVVLAAAVITGRSFNKLGALLGPVLPLLLVCSRDTILRT